MKALKINSTERTVVDIEINDWREIAPAIGNNCNTFECPIILDNNDSVYVDEEGLYHEIHGGFMINGFGHVIVGNGIVEGADENGESCDVKTTKEELQSMIVWLDKDVCIKWTSKF